VLQPAPPRPASPRPGPLPAWVFGVVPAVFLAVFFAYPVTRIVGRGLSSEGEPDLVKINDWELAEFVCGPVSTPALMLAGAQRLRDGGARSVIVTRGELPALVLHEDRAWQLTPPRFEHGFREGCGDSMMGGLAAAWALGESFERALVLGAAAGAANFLQRGLAHASREVVEKLADAVTLESWPVAAAA